MTHRPLILTFCAALLAGLFGVSVITPAPAYAATPSPMATRTPTATRTPAVSPTPTATPIPQPYDPAPVSGLLSGIAPTQYLSDKCQYIREYWDPQNSQPGTIVAPVMFHSVTLPGHPIPASDHTSISAESFANFMEHARQLGFQTITATQLVNFLEHNAKIPPRSMILIIDDRRPGTVREHFLPLLNQYDWTVTLGYITGVVQPPEWQELDALAATGRIDVQAHGFLHNGSTYITAFTPEETVLREIFAPVPLIRQHFGNDPVAFIWPGGDFTAASVQMARQAHYRIGFTSYSRGPVAFNWIPQGAEERAAGDPRMLLPRYWSPAAFVALDESARISDQQAAYAAAHKAEQLQWQAQNCPE
ncbi:MAG TPA: polysaccharide deacetylase family protein [Armatimonadota bacterium]|jgi:peptidoglycan/xylan/chitin deacetylase (PgdA/CDA1 family)